MENVTDALIMAGSVLIFIVALTVSMSSFSKLRASVDRIVTEPETVQLAKDSHNEYINYYESEDNGDIRKVGSETVISSIYRARKENYVIYIKLKGYPQAWGSNIKNYTNESLKINNNILIKNGEEVLVIDNNDDDLKNIINNSSKKINLYQNIKDKTFYEYLGEYQDATNVSAANKLINRIITYIEI